jgi:hypothetical protein
MWHGAASRLWTMRQSTELTYIREYLRGIETKFKNIFGHPKSRESQDFHPTVFNKSIPFGPLMII